jgi:hypothetical protein
MSIKTQFKYAFMAGLRMRGATIGGTMLVLLVFVLLAASGSLHPVANIAFVALGGCAMGTVIVVSIIADITSIRRIFSAPDAYFYALTPAPGWKKLAANVAAMAILDIVPLAVMITGQVYLSLSFAGGNILSTAMSVAQVSTPDVIYIIWAALAILAAYLLFMMVILFCVAAKKSFLYHTRAPGLLAVLLGWGCFYAFSLLHLLLAPFGTVTWHGGPWIAISLRGGALPLYALFILLCAGGLFVLTSKLTERKLNI